MLRRINAEERAELARAIRSGEIENATAFAEAFAHQHGLNPITVRSAISRLRRELGMLTRHPRAESGKRNPPAPTGMRSPPAPRNPEAIGFMELLWANDGVAQIGAAVLVRYEDDEDFRHAVDLRRADVEKIYSKLKELRKAAETLADDERDDVLRLLLSAL